MTQTAHELSVTRYIAAPPAAVWHAMTERIEEWWCPRPWRMRIIDVEWRAGLDLFRPLVEYAGSERAIFGDHLINGESCHESRDRMGFSGCFQIVGRGIAMRLRQLFFCSLFSL